MSLETDVAKLWDAVVRQGGGMTKLEPLVFRIKDAVNKQANGLRNLENRVQQLEGLLMRAAHQGRAGPQPQMRTINPLRALPSVNTARDLVEVDDSSADADFEYEDDDQEVG